jgi:iron complex transport system ATP-binding protein
MVSKVVSRELEADNGQQQEARGVPIEANSIAIGFDNGRILQDISLRVKAGEMVALLGANGSGKTTLMRVLSGTLRPQTGSVTLADNPINQLSRLEIARIMAMLAQDASVPYAVNVLQVVMMGRIPYLRPLVGESKVDYEVAQRAMEATRTDHLARRIFSELSGGERQRVLVAMALAQEPRLLLLDEPTVHLDINHQVEVLDLVRSINRQEGITVLAVMHDLNLAAMYFDRLVFIQNGFVVADGLPREVLLPELVQRVFHTPVAVMSHPVTASPHVIILPRNGHDNDNDNGNGTAVAYGNDHRR